MRIGVDLGGTKIEAIALAGDGSTLSRQRVPTPQGDYQGTLKQITTLVRRMESGLGIHAKVGIGTPGSPSPATGLIRNANSTCLNKRPLQQDLALLLDREIRIANDADCFALSEANDGAGKGADTVFGVILGTGVGGGICHRGQLLSGPNCITGEWGHNPLPWPTSEELPGPRCYCGKRGCIETFLSGPGLSSTHREHHCVDITASEIADRANAGDITCRHSLAIYEERLSRALASVINVLDPDVIVLGGGMSNVSRLYQALPALLLKHIFSDTVRTGIVPPAHGDSSGVRGAAWLWPA